MNAKRRERTHTHTLTPHVQAHILSLVSTNIFKIDNTVRQWHAWSLNDMHDKHDMVIECGHEMHAHGQGNSDYIDEHYKTIECGHEMSLNMNMKESG